MRGNNGTDQIGVYFLIGFEIPYPILVTPSRVYWDYGGTPPGSIVSFPNTFVHPGWLPCDGRGANTTQQDLLFDILGYGYGGSGATFLLPDYRGYALVGADNMGAGSAGRFFNFGPNGITGEVQPHPVASRNAVAHPRRLWPRPRGQRSAALPHHPELSPWQRRSTSSQGPAGTWSTPRRRPTPRPASASRLATPTFAPSGSSGAHNNVSRHEP